jgi:hypothetical protein
MNIQPFDHDREITKAHEYDYQIFTMWSKDSVNTTAQGLLHLASWVEGNRAQLQQEVKALDISPRTADKRANRQEGNTISRFEKKENDLGGNTTALSYEVTDDYGHTAQLPPEQAEDLHQWLTRQLHHVPDSEIAYKAMEAAPQRLSGTIFTMRTEFLVIKVMRAESRGLKGQ